MEVRVKQLFGGLGVTYNVLKNSNTAKLKLPKTRKFLWELVPLVMECNLKIKWIVFFLFFFLL